MSQIDTPKSRFIEGFAGIEIKVLDEVLQEQENPVEFLKSFTEKMIVVIVPNEWSWPAELKPFTNAKHKHHYDTDLLAQDLEAAGLIYIIKLLEFNSWSFLTAECAHARDMSSVPKVV